MAHKMDISDVKGMANLIPQGMPVLCQYAGKSGRKCNEFITELHEQVKYSEIRHPYWGDYLNDNGGHTGLKPCCVSADALEGCGISSEIWNHPGPTHMCLPS